MLRFESSISDFNENGIWKIVMVPPEVVEALGAKTRFDVRGLIDGVPFQRTLLSDGHGGYFIVTNADMRRRIGKGLGSPVVVEMEPDETYKVVELPDYFEEELDQNPVAKAAYEKCPPSSKRWIAQYLTEVKSLDAKANRVVKALEILEKWAARHKKKANR